MGALDGVRVIEVAAMGPVPLCGMLLGDMGADVLRIDRIGPDEAETAISPASDLRGRNKRSACLDLKHPDGRAAFLRLAGTADIVLEGWRPGVAERLGIGPAECLAVNPRLVYGRATGWGREGPLAMTAGHDINYLALTGALAMIGPPGGAPVPPLNLVADYGGGALYLAFGVLCALHAARASGRGQVVDAAMIDGVASLLTVFHGMRQAGFLEPERGANRLDGGAPWYTTYETSDGRYVAVGAIEPKFWAALLAGLGLDPAALPRRSDRAAWPELRARLAARFREAPRDKWADRFAATDACVTPVLSLDEAGAHPHNRARGMLERVAGREHPAAAPRLSRTPGAIRSGPSRPGEHTAAALGDWGLASTEIEDGLARGFFA